MTSIMKPFLYPHLAFISYRAKRFPHKTVPALRDLGSCMVPPLGSPQRLPSIYTRCPPHLISHVLTIVAMFSPSHCPRTQLFYRQFSTFVVQARPKASFPTVAHAPVRRHHPPLIMPPSQRPSSSGAKPAPSHPRPSSSILLLSSTNEVLLLHRVRTSTSFASAHVFPGGNLDVLHDGDIPAPDAPQRHVDGPAYRMGAIRECFEETGILLAKKDGALVNLPVEERDAARKKIHGGELKFGDWLESIGGIPDTGSYSCVLFND